MSNLLHRMLSRIAAFILPGNAFKIVAPRNSDTVAVQSKAALTPVPIFNKQLNIPAGVANMPTSVLYVQPPPKPAVYTMLIPKPQAAMQTMAAYYQTAKNMIMKKVLATMMSLLFLSLFVQGQTANTQVGENSANPTSTTEMLFLQNSKASVVATNLNHTNTTNISGNVYYIRYSGGENWGSPDNVNALTAVFGSFTTTNFVAAVPATIFSAATGFVLMEGGNAGATELNNFLTANMTQIQNWVAAGGRLYIKAAPNVGGNINLGFGGALLTYPNFSSTATATIPGHPIFIGPYTPVATSYTGNFSLGMLRNCSVAIINIL